MKLSACDQSFLRVRPEPLDWDALRKTPTRGKKAVARNTKLLTWHYGKYTVPHMPCTKCGQTVWTGAQLVRDTATPLVLQMTCNQCSATRAVGTLRQGYVIPGNHYVMYSTLLSVGYATVDVGPDSGNAEHLVLAEIDGPLNAWPKKKQEGWRSAQALVLADVFRNMDILPPLALCTPRYAKLEQLQAISSSQGTVNSLHVRDGLRAMRGSLVAARKQFRTLLGHLSQLQKQQE